ncbi:Protein of unknown function DUF58 [Noviherbaspirillum humi]|uniref:DUF58 domain-containing protein n=1 Tax=Noviherbaspirillum humi TaxID=1688639 RepID=A0A239C1R8_9BURK|nr:DUF58 domain-containing protein [Noviherbaspirillum humi]SNS14197.1 Protein of unknown function DUF58 [Noviherbaspirillum humi]
MPSPPPRSPKPAQSLRPAQSPRPEQLLRHVEWTVLRRLDGLLQGDYRTLMRGTGLDLADLREYQHGDDVRHIDWNVTARMQSPYIRQFTEDREMTAWFLLDLSASLDFGSGDVRKRNLSAGFVAALARLLSKHGNRVGAVIYGAGVERVIPPGTSRRHVLFMLEQINHRPESTPHGETRLLDLLQSAGNLLKRRSTVFVVSDFISEPGWEKALAWLARRHEVLAVHLSDPLERDLPDLGLLTLEDAESGEQLLVDTHDPAFRNRLTRLADEREAMLLQGLASAGVDALELSTDDDLFESLLRFVELRKQRLRSQGGGLSGPRGKFARHLLPVSQESA